MSAAHRFAYAGLALLGAALTGVTAIVFTAVAGRTPGLVAGVCAVALFALFWLLLPVSLRGREF
ncbi:membrane protein [Mycobacterium tuberculosis]|nr:membrane protein [Mycobacterium tuberculosis]